MAQTLAISLNVCANGFPWTHLRRNKIGHDLAQLYELAFRFRTAIELCDKTKLPVSFADFPNGSCGDTVLLLAKYLEKNGYSPFDYMCGVRDGRSHAWLQQGELVIDVTADQFPDLDDPVIVRHTSLWHASFAGEALNEADFEIYDPYTRNILRNAFNTILRCLNE